LSDMPDYVRAVYTSVKNTWQDAENLDDAHGYISYIWIPEETFKVDVMKLRVYAEKFRAHSKAALAGGAQVVTSGASSTSTTVAGGAHSHPVTGATSSYTTPSHTHDVVIGTKTSAGGGSHSHSVTGATSSYVLPSHTHDVVIGTKTSAGGGSHSHSVTGATSSYVLPSHTHDVVIGTKTSAAGGQHLHKLFEWESDTPGGYSSRKLKAARSAVATTFIDLATAETCDFVTMYSAVDHTHDVVVGTVTSASGGGNHAHTVSGQTAEAVGTHTHDVIIGTVTSASGGGNHAHTVSGQTAEAVTDHSHGMEHTHQVTLPDHTHGIDFGIYEEDITGRTLSAILYDPDGNLVKDFGVVTTDEDNVTIDLSEYFETLKYGFWRLVLSASGRIRARLIFYELCKMYAQF